MNQQHQGNPAAAMAFLYGTGLAPLEATRRYTFRRGVSGPLTLEVSTRQRGSWDDFGVVEYAAQEAFVSRLLASLESPCSTGYPGEWRFPDATSLNVAWDALAAALREPVTTPPEVSASRTLGATEAAAASAALVPRYLELVSTLSGLSGDAFVRFNHSVDTETPETRRHEAWKRGEVIVQVDATAIESGYGVHGEHVTLATSVRMSAADASVSAHLDVRSGGRVDVTVRGVFDGPQLAEAFLASLAAM